MRNSRWRGMFFKDNRFVNFAEGFLKYLKHREGTKEDFEDIIEYARLSLFDGEDCALATDPEEVIKRLIEGEKNEWALLLQALIEYPFGESLFEEFKPLSPFADKIFVVIGYGFDFAGGPDLKNFLLKLVTKKESWQTWDDDFVIILPPDIFNGEKVDTYWVGGDYKSIKKRKRPKKSD